MLKNKPVADKKYVAKSLKETKYWIIMFLFFMLVIWILAPPIDLKLGILIILSMAVTSCIQISIIIRLRQLTYELVDEKESDSNEKPV